MNTKSKNIELAFDKLVYSLLPLAIIGPGTIDMVLCFFGLYETTYCKSLVKYGLLLFTLIISLIKILCLFREDSHKRKIIRSSVVLFAFFVLYFLALLKWGLQPNIIHGLLSEGFYLMLMWSTIVLLYCEGRIGLLLSSFKAYMIIVSPTFVYYLIRFIISDEVRYYIISWGSLSYMSIAYLSLLFIVLTASYDYLCDSEEKIHTALRFSFVLLCASVIGNTDCKGAQVCACWFAVLNIVFGLWLKRSVIRTIIRSILIICIVALFAIILPNLLKYETRTSAFVEESTSEARGENINSVVLDIHNEEIASKLSSIDSVVEYVQSNMLENDYENGIVSKDEYDILMEMYVTIETSNYGPRVFLYKSAISEIKKSPLCGGGVYFFQQKYQIYPHNIVLELATDFGLVISFIIVILFAITVLYSIVCLKSDMTYACFVLYVFTFIPKWFVSGSLYDCNNYVQYSFLIFFTYQMFKKIKRTNKSPKMQHSK